MDVSIIIVSYNTCELLSNCISSIYKNTQDISFEIIVVDNASIDNSIVYIKKYYPNVIVVPLMNNIGFGRANNNGAEIAKGDSLFFLNPDTLLINNAIYILHEYLCKNKHVAIVGGNLYHTDLTANGSYSMQFPKVLDEILRVYNYNRCRDLDFFNYGEAKKVAFVTGADLMIRKSVFTSIGGFSPEFFMYCEEPDIAKRIANLNLEIHSVPDAKIIHINGGASSSNKKGFSATRFYSIMSYLKYAKKYFGNYYYLLYFLYLFKAVIAYVLYLLLNNQAKIRYWKAYIKTVFCSNSNIVYN